MTHAYDGSRGDALSRAAPLAEPARNLSTIERARGWDPVVLVATADADADLAHRPPRPREGGGAAAPGRRRLIGLDGLRAVAVLAVVVFHLDYALAPGGFLGVDVFFVISGFLITTMVAEEILRTGRLQLGRFYLRRAQRLLPTVLVMLAVVSVAAVTVWRDQLDTVRSGVLSSLGYVTNWWLIADDRSYFASTGRPPMVQHLWSLAIEEQFYLVWSVLVVTIVALAARRARAGDPAGRVRLVAVVALCLAVASTVAMAVLAVRADLPYRGDTSRVYFGSDTHSMGLFLGAACGAWLAVRRRAAPVRPGRLPAKLVWLTDVVGMVLLAVLVAQFFDVSEFSPRLYRGGFLAFDLLALAVIVCALRRRSLLGRILDMRPIAWVGRRSYSIYIWHWPVVVVTRPDLDVHGPAWVVNTCRLVLVLGLAALSHHFVEIPFRSGQFAAWRRVRRSGARRRWDTAAVLTTLVAALALGAAAGAVGPPIAAAHLPVVPTAPATHAAGPAPSTAAPTAPSSRHATRPPAPVDVSAYGDSVLLGARSALRAVVRRLDLDAVEGRQPYQVLDDVLRDARAGTLQPDVVIHAGNNGIMSPDQLRATLRALRDRARVVLVDDRVSRDWQDPNNATIRRAAAGFRNVVVVDWHALSTGRQGWLYPDGLHLTRRGARAYAAMIRDALLR